MLKDKDIVYILHKSMMLAKCSFSNKLNALGITPGQFTVLKEIYYHQKETSDLGLAPACIATRLECDRPTISGIIERLEAQGWVGRLHNPEDKRSFIIRVTQKAIDNLKELEEISSENREIFTNGFTEEELISFKSFLLRVVDNYKALEQ